jgi:dTDP-glucose 4,6-dehydratase
MDGEIKKIVYVTGCLGFIGSYVTRACLKKGWYVRGIDKLTYASNPKFLEEFKHYPNFVFEQKDINDLDWLYDCDYIINTAAETHVDNSIVKSDDFIHSNINGVHNLLELIRNRNTFKMPTLLHFSTDEVYGDIVDGAHKETDLLKPSNPYSSTKSSADQLILAWSRTYKVPYVIVRPTNNYGVGQYVEKLIPKTCKFLTTGRKIPLHNGGEPYRMWLHAKDTASAIITIIESNSVNEIYNISGDFEQKNIDTVRKIVELYYGHHHIDVGESELDINKYCDFSYDREGQDVRYSVDDSKLRALGWKPTSKFDEELIDIVKYYKEVFIW